MEIGRGWARVLSLRWPGLCGNGNGRNGCGGGGGGCGRSCRTRRTWIVIVVGRGWTGDDGGREASHVLLSANSPGGTQAREVKYLNSQGRWVPNCMT